MVYGGERAAEGVRRSEVASGATAGAGCGVHAKRARGACEVDARAALNYRAGVDFVQ